MSLYSIADLLEASSIFWVWIDIPIDWHKWQIDRQTEVIVCTQEPINCTWHVEYLTALSTCAYGIIILLICNVH